MIRIVYDRTLSGSLLKLKLAKYLKIKIKYILKIIKN